MANVQLTRLRERSVIGLWNMAPEQAGVDQTKQQRGEGATHAASNALDDAGRGSTTEPKRAKVEADDTLGDPASQLSDGCIVGLTEPTLLTGGAGGADTVWFKAFDARQWRTITYSFAGHKVPYGHLAEPPMHTMRLVPSADAGEAGATNDADNDDDADAGAAQRAIQTAARHLCRQVPKRPFVLQLMRRNYAIAQAADALYAVGHLETPKVPRSQQDALALSVRVDGGTGWTCQMFADRFPLESPGVLPLFLFDVRRKMWLQCTRTSTSALEWTAYAQASLVPHLQHFQAVAGIGSRMLTPEGEAAIRELVGRRVTSLVSVSVSL